jgi:hypothetical protein
VLMTLETVIGATPAAEATSVIFTDVLLSDAERAAGTRSGSDTAVSSCCRLIRLSLTRRCVRS